jgi:hypothetical protein
MAPIRTLFERQDPPYRSCCPTIPHGLRRRPANHLAAGIARGWKFRQHAGRSSVRDTWKSAVAISSGFNEATASSWDCYAPPRMLMVDAATRKEADAATC